jgi:MipA family protein
MASTLLRPAIAATLVMLAGHAAAQSANAPDAAASAPAAAAPAAPADPPRDAPDPPSQPRFEGAIGLILHYDPEFTGAANHHLHATPSIFLRYGRWTFSNSGLFVTRRKDDIFQGLGSDLHRGDTVRTHFSLRLERGHASARSSELPDTPETRTTVRGRLNTTWMPQGLDRADGWKFNLGVSTDLLGRGGGQTLDLGLSREHDLGHGLRWSYGAGVSAASARYMRTRFEVTPEEAARTGYPAYRPGAGLQDASVGTSWRWLMAPQWQAIWGVSAGRLMGPAADSPLTQKRNHWEAQLGAARSF